MHKGELEHRLRGSRTAGGRNGRSMRFVGIDIASETHYVAAVAEEGEVLLKATAFNEDEEGYERLFSLIGSPGDALVAMEATGHYWQNVYAVLLAREFKIVLINPLRTRRFAEEDLKRAKTDSIDALQIAKFVREKRPQPTALPDSTALELRELVRLRDRLVDERDDKIRQLHRLVDLGFPEFTRHVRLLGHQLATTILSRYPTAQAFRGLKVKRLAGLTYGKRKFYVGEQLARALIDAAERSVGQHHTEPYQVQVKYLCEDLDTLRRRIEDIEGQIEAALAKNDVGSLLTTIDGIGPQTAARLVSELGDITRFRDGNALASYVGVVPGTTLSGKGKTRRFALAPIGNARLRAALWMPTLVAVKKNPWLRAFYDRLVAEGKLRKVALVAAMRKLLTAIYSVAKNRKPFVPNVSAIQPCR
jgi:transposase